MRERLIELIREARLKETYTTSNGKPATIIDRRIVDISEVGVLADYLLANGVIALPCKVGDNVYAVDKRSGLWWHGKIISMYYANKNDIQFAVAFDDGEVAIYDWDSVFPTKEEAEQALRKEDEGK